MNTLRMMVIGLAVLVTPISVMASCNNEITTADLNACFAKEYKFYDQKLSRTYLRLLSSYGASDKNELIKAQRLWVQFKEADCKVLVRSYHGGSIGAWIGLQCLRDKSIQREAELADRLGE